MMTAGAVRFSKSLDLLKLTSPSYLVCLDMMKADLRVRKSVLGQSEASCWQKSFSATLVLSSLLPRGLLSGEPFLHGPGARIESYGSWNRQSSYFHTAYRAWSVNLFYYFYLTLFVEILCTSGVES